MSLAKKQHKPQATLIAISPGQTASKGVLLTHETQEFSDDTRDKSVSQTQKVTHHNPTSRLIFFAQYWISMNFLLG